MLQQRVNQAGTVPRDGGIVNPQTRVNDRYAEAVAAIAKAAATVGLNYTPEQLRTLSPTQLQQVANMISRRRSQLSAAATQGTVPLNHQVRRNEAQISANPHLSAGMGTNMANWMSRSGSAAQGGNSQVGVGQVPVRSQAMNLEMRKQALQNGSSSRTSAGASSGKSDLNNLSANPAAGTVPQMNEMLAQQAIRVDKTGNSTQGKKTAQDIQDPSGVRSSPVARTAASGHLQAGGAVTGGLPSSRAPSGQRAASAGNVSEEEIWAKLNDMQRKYRENMRRLLPVIVTLQNARSPEKSELLMQHLRDVVSILNMSRTSATSKGLTMERLHKAEQFIQRVLYVHTKYVEEKNSQPRSAQPVGNLEDYVRQPAGTAHGTEIPSQPASQMPTTGMIHHVKTDTGLPPGVTPEANALRQQRIEQQKARQLLHMQQNQPTGYAHGGLSNGGHADLSKAASQNTTGKGGAQRPRRNTKAARTNQGLPMSRSISGLMPGQQRLQHPQAPGQEQVVAAAQQQAQAIVEAKAAATRANLESQAAKAQAEVQGLKKVQAKSLANLYPAVDQASRMEQLGALKNMQSHAQSVGPNSHGLATGSVHQQMPQRGGSNMPGTAVPDTGPGASRAKRPELTIQQRMQIVDARVKEACEQARKLEAMREAEIKRDKSERIQTTLAALRNTSGTTSGDGDKSGGTKRQVSLVDVDNVGLKEGVIKPKTVFECSSEAGLRLAKRPKNEAADLRSLREAVEADCRAAKERNPLLLVEIYEEFGLPVVTCLLRIPEIRLPKLVLRVQRGYPRKGGATYGFERPPMGWIGVLEDIRTRFKQGLATTPTASVGVAAFLHVWATAADDVINGSCLSESR